MLAVTRHARRPKRSYSAIELESNSGTLTVTKDSGVQAERLIRIRNASGTQAFLGVPQVLSFTGAGAASMAASISLIAGAYYLRVRSTTTANSAGTLQATAVVYDGTGGRNSITASYVADLVTESPAAPATFALLRSDDDTHEDVGVDSGLVMTNVVINTGSNPLGTISIGNTTYSSGESGWASASIVNGHPQCVIDCSGTTVAGFHYVDIEVLASGAPGRVELWRIWNDLNATVIPAALTVSPTSVARSAPEGQIPSGHVLSIGNAGGSPLGNLSVSIIGGATWLSVALNGTTQAIITYLDSALAIGNYASVVRVTSENGGSRDIAVDRAVTTAQTGLYPGPVLAQLPLGMGWDSATGKPTGSIFNVPGAHPSLANYAEPPTTGTVYTVASNAEFITRRGQIAAGTIVGGDEIRVADNVTLDNQWLPPRPGYVDGVTALIKITWVNRPAYSATGWGRTERARPAFNMLSCPTFRSTVTNQSCLRFFDPSNSSSSAAPTCGYWIAGFRFYGDTPTNTGILLDFQWARASGGGTAGPSSIANLNRHLIVANSYFASANGHGDCVQLNANFSAVLHCHFDLSWSPNHAEPHSVQAFNCQGPIAIKGCRLAGQGIHVLLGGAHAPVDGVIVDSVDCTFTYGWKDPSKWPLLANDKNAFEVKCATRVLFGFARFQNMGYKGDQQYGLLVKCNAQAIQPPGNPPPPPIESTHAARSENVTFWAIDMRENCGKSMLDIGGVSRGPNAVNTMNVEAAHIAHAYTLGAITLGNPQPTNAARTISISGGLKNGFSGIRLRNLTYYGQVGDIALSPNSLQSGFANVDIRDLVNQTECFNGPIFRSSGNGNDTALSGYFPPGTYSVQKLYHAYNAAPPNSFDFNATMKAAPFLCDTFTDPAATFENVNAKDFRIKAGAVDRGGSPIENAGTDGRDPGCDFDYLESVLADVIDT